LAIRARPIQGEKSRTQGYSGVRDGFGAFFLGEIILEAPVQYHSRRSEMAASGAANGAISTESGRIRSVITPQLSRGRIGILMDSSCSIRSLEIRSETGKSEREEITARGLTASTKAGRPEGELRC